MIRNDVREKHEEEFKENNEKPLSVCSGVFFIGNRKHTIVCQNCSKCHKNKRYRMRIEDVPEVKFRHAESFRRCKLYEQTINEEYVTTVSVFNILYTNDLACSAILDLFDGIKYKDKESQKIYGALLKRMKEYQRSVNDYVKESTDINDFADFNALMDDVAEPIVEELHEAVSEELKNHGVEDYDYISRGEIARTLVDFSLFSLKTRREECWKYGVNLVILPQFCLEKLKPIMDNFSDWQIRNIKDVNLAQDRFTDIIRKLSKKMTDADMLTEFIGRTLDKKYFEKKEEWK